MNRKNRAASVTSERKMREAFISISFSGLESWVSGGLPFGEHALHHQAGHHRPGVLVLAGDQVAVGDVVIGEEVAHRMGAALEERARRTERRLRMERRDRNAELLDLPVGDGGEPAALHEKL